MCLFHLSAINTLIASSFLVASAKFTVSIWRPLHGPLTDWPLSVADSRTLKPSRDCIATDIVDRTGFTENFQIYYSPELEFYYLSRQLESEIILFRQTDTKEGCGTGKIALEKRRLKDEADGNIGVPHAGFRNPNTIAGERPRESVETRVFMYW